MDSLAPESAAGLPQPETKGEAGSYWGNGGGVGAPLLARDSLAVPADQMQTFTISAPDAAAHSVVFFGKGGIEIVRIASDGFWVRGKKLEQDETESRALFDAMLEFFRAPK